MVKIAIVWDWVQNQADYGLVEAKGHPIPKD